MNDCTGETPVGRLHSLGVLGGNFLAVHANYLGPADAQRLALSRSSVAHCPRSHAYFRHRPFPWPELASAGVNICLGTDSLVSTRKEQTSRLELDMFAEMRAAATAFPGLPPETIMRWATVNGARALGAAGQLGELCAGAFADLVALPWAGKTAQVFEAMVYAPQPVCAVMIDGRWAIY